VKAPSCAVAIETAQPADFPGASPAEQLARFRGLLLAKASLKVTSAKPTSASYQSRHGETLECAFDGSDRINGEAVDYKAWPTSQSPWTTQKRPEDPLEIKDGRTLRTYDFSTWKIRERSE
jgi:hypothetical protein